jgi:OOP family OmpA-OmpF porin
MKRTWALAVPAMLAALATGTRAAADTGFAIDRFEPSAKGSQWFVLDSLDLRGRLRPAIGVVADYGYKPLVLYNADGTERSDLVRHQLFLHLGGSVVLADRVRLALNLPVAVYQDGDGGSLNGQRFAQPTSTTLGDLRLDADLRLLGQHGDPFTAAFGAQLHLPTGDRNSYAGDGGVRLTPHLLASGEIGSFAYAASVGFTYHAQDEAYAGNPLGSDLVLGGAAGLLVAEKSVLVGPEVYGRTVVTDSNAVFARHQSPLEALMGMHVTLADAWRLGAGAGSGITRGFGSPELRLVASIEWAPQIAAPPLAAPRDRDRDGILDAEDACPDDPGVRTTDPKTNGCPPPPPPIPPSDRDNDGILDAEDACPDVPGVKTNDPKTNGCPPPPPSAPSDRDHDGIPDADDACPDVPGERDPDPKKNGCPKAIVQHGLIQILDQVKFKTASADLLPESDDTLGAVLKVMTEHPEIKRVSVEGHTDNHGGVAYNQDLSRRRAASVVKWLAVHGIDRARLSSVGYGQERPVDTNATEAGRQNNRRVEFHIAEGPGAQPPAGNPAPPSAVPAAPRAPANPTPKQPGEVFTP